MKRLLLIFMLIGVLGLSACGSDNNETESPNPEIIQSTLLESSVSESQETVSEENTTEWGVTQRFSTSNNDIRTPIFINFPDLSGIPEGTGLIAYQDDATRVVLDSYLGGVSPEVEGIEDVLPAYFEQTKAIFRANFGVQYSDAQFIIHSQELVSINDYEMCKYIGTHKYMYDGKPCDNKYVAYTTQVKANGAYIYWLVQDESKDQSLFETIEEYAYKMATTLLEE